MYKLEKKFQEISPEINNVKVGLPNVNLGQQKQTVDAGIVA